MPSRSGRVARPLLLSSLAAAILLTTVILAGVFTASAQVGEQDPCRMACRDEKSRCETSCSQHSNPIECEQSCQEDYEDCIVSC